MPISMIRSRLYEYAINLTEESKIRNTKKTQISGMSRLPIATGRPTRHVRTMSGHVRTCAGVTSSRRVKQPESLAPSAQTLTHMPNWCPLITYNSTGATYEAIY